MNILSIDIGNTNASIAKHLNCSKLEVKKLEKSQLAFSSDDFVIMSSVREDQNIFNDFPYLKEIKRVSNYIVEGKVFDMNISYTKTLGEDRIANAFHAFNKIKEDNHQKAIVIDSGTFNTIDFIGPKGFEGGYIFPNDKEVLKLYQSGELLKPFSKKIDLKLGEFPQSTSQAILGSVEKMFNSAIKEILENFAPDIIFLTGGNLEFHQRVQSLTEIKNIIIPNMVHLGLYDIARKVS